MIRRVITLDVRNVRPSGVFWLSSHTIKYRLGCGFDRSDRPRLEFSRPGLTLDDEDPRLHLGLFEGHVGQGFDFEPRGHFDDLSGNIGPRRRASHDRASELASEVAAIQEDGRSAALSMPSALESRAQSS